jgi:hypothetical protein
VETTDWILFQYTITVSVANQISPWAPFEKSTASFLALYTEVTERSRRVMTRFVPEEQRWIDSLMEGFLDKYKQWKYDGVVRDYLERLDDAAGGKTKDEALLVVGHAYLHICYDLPRTIAETLPRFRIDDERAGWVFRQLAPIFADAFWERIRKQPSILGWYRTVFWFLRPALSRSKMRTILELASAYVIDLRSIALINGLRLKDHRGAHRRHLEDLIWIGIDIQSRLVSQSSDVTEWLRLRSPELPVPPGNAVSTYENPSKDAGGLAKDQIEAKDFLS